MTCPGINDLLFFDKTIFISFCLTHKLYDGWKRIIFVWLGPNNSSNNNNDNDKELFHESLTESLRNVHGLNRNWVQCLKKYWFEFTNWGLDYLEFIFYFHILSGSYNQVDESFMLFDCCIYLDDV